MPNLRYKYGGGNMKIKIIYVLIFSILPISLFAQEDTLSQRKGTLTGSTVFEEDTIPLVQMEEIVVFPPLKFKNRRQYRRYTKLVRDLKKVYPYAQLAKKKLDEMEKEFNELKTEQERKRYVKTVEKQLMDEFGDELKKLTITQGRLLLKLIDRETGSTSYELLKELRGSFSAVFWQAIARIFGSNLKSEYDAFGEDYLIERIVIQIEHNQL